jgi:hypothetical protein
MSSEAVAVTERVVRALETLQIPYLIGGSMAILHLRWRVPAHS